VRPEQVYKLLGIKQMENKTTNQLIRDYLADGNYDRLIRRLKTFNIKLTDLQICRLIESI
jgi:hypothetical protein